MLNVGSVLSPQDIKQIDNSYSQKRILITGAAGSICSELAKQVIGLKPALLVLVDVAESPLVDLYRELQSVSPQTRIIPLLQDICHSRRMGRVFSLYKPQVVFHAAAYKHVPLLQEAIWPAINTNVWGTYVVAKLALRHKSERFILLSTDKAVQPTCLMGATKWLAEQWMDVLAQQNKSTSFMAIRFGNVIGSRGSVLPLWKSQLASNESITVTNPEMERFFIGVTDACQRMLLAGVHGENGGLYGFWMPTYTMGQLAKYMLLLAGKDASACTTIGIRPGEKLKERLLSDQENLGDDICSEVFEIEHPKANSDKIEEVTANLLEAMRFYMDERMWRLILSLCPTVAPPIKVGKAIV
jgi:FlaA1/EpsC-like NDP-sugar epimerase